MNKTRRDLLAERSQPQKDLIGCVAWDRLVWGNPEGISDPTNHPEREGCEPTGRTTRESNWSLVTNDKRKATHYLIGEANSVCSRDQGRADASSGVHGTARWESNVGEHGRSSPAYPKLRVDKPCPIRRTPKGTKSREEVRQGHSSEDRWDSITQRERRVLTLAWLKLRRRIGDWR